LLLLAGGPAGDTELADKFAVHGIDPARIEIAGRRPRQAYLELHNRLDVALDPFPFNGDNTLCDALLMGVPTVTLAGDTFVSRRGVSHLNNVGMGELVAASLDVYITKAVALAQDIPRLISLRPLLRQLLMTSPLTDATVFIGQLEKTYCWMWRRWSE
jgi:predicted O-linked N-acetylglucosamine transferase (SPINDLY family)